jgi:hypothetical protein
MEAGREIGWGAGCGERRRRRVVLYIDGWWSGTAVEADGFCCKERRFERAREYWPITGVNREGSGKFRSEP